MVPSNASVSMSFVALLVHLVGFGRMSDTSSVKSLHKLSGPIDTRTLWLPHRPSCLERYSSWKTRFGSVFEPPRIGNGAFNCSAVSGVRWCCSRDSPSSARTSERRFWSPMAAFLRSEFKFLLIPCRTERIPARSREISGVVVREVAKPVYLFGYSGGVDIQCKGSMLPMAALHGATVA